jgi:hypothetical protein
VPSQPQTGQLHPGGLPPVPHLPDRASGIDGTEDRRPGFAPGRSTSLHRERLEKELQDALNAIEEVKAQRVRLGDSLRTWQQIVLLTKRRLRELEDLEHGPQLSFSAIPAQERQNPKSPASLERFGKFVIPIVKQLIHQLNRAVAIDEIYEALPAHIRDELDALPSAYSTQYRIRRMLRRSKDFIVTPEGVELAPQITAPKTFHIVATIRDDAANLSALKIEDGRTIRHVTPRWVEEALEDGDTFIIRANERDSVLGLGDGQFYTSYNDVENDDFFKIPVIKLSDVASIPVEDGSDLVD